MTREAYHAREHNKPPPAIPPTVYVQAGKANETPKAQQRHSLHALPLSLTQHRPAGRTNPPSPSPPPTPPHPP